MRPADAYRARHRGPSPADAYRAKYGDAGSICAIADLRVEDEGVASASLSGLPDDLWRRICAFARPAKCARALGRYLSIELGPEGNALMLELHCLVKVLTEIGLDRKAVGEPEGHERAFAKLGGGHGGIALKQAMFMVQDHIREGLRKP